MRIAPQQLRTHLKKSLLPCYLVTGDEPLLIQESLDLLRSRAREIGFGARELHVAGPGFDWSELRNSGGNLSLFAEKKIVELRLPTGKPGRSGSAAIVEFTEMAAEDLLFLVSAPKLDRGSAAAKWATTVSSTGAIVQVRQVGMQALPTWIAARMKASGMQPDQEATQMIASRVEGNLLAAQQEIEKLRMLNGEGPVTAADVDASVADSSRFDVYKLVDAAIAADTPRAIRILGSLRIEGTEPVIVVWALTRELRTLARLADSIRDGGNLGSSLRKFGVWSSRENLVRSCVSRHKDGDFYALIKLARRADAAAKGQIRLDPWQLATEIVLGLGSDSARAA